MDQQGRVENTNVIFCSAKECIVEEKISLDVSKRTVSRYLRHLCARAASRKLWAAFLRNHSVLQPTLPGPEAEQSVTESRIE